jgi:hypothetical protein
MQGNGADDYLSFSYAVTEDARIPLSPRRYRNGFAQTMRPARSIGSGASSGI